MSHVAIRYFNDQTTRLRAGVRPCGRPRTARDNARKAGIEVQMKEIALARRVAPRLSRRFAGARSNRGEGGVLSALPDRRE
jgi:hypothetical protein